MRELAQSLLEAGLVDELQLVVGPAFGSPVTGCSPTPGRDQVVAGAREVRPRRRPHSRT